MTPGKYKAKLKIQEHRNLALFCITHYITIHDDGSVTESHYTDGEEPAKFFFRPERVWDPALLDRYHVLPV